jgi:hypothetical protein
MDLRRLSPLLLLVAAPAAHADGGKGRVDLFHPTPALYMRELDADRPDETESPYTVDAGHFQVESDVGRLSLEKHGRDVAMMTMTVRIGLTDRTELQVITDPLHAGSSPGVPGVVDPGESTVGLKVNLFGNDDADLGAGIIAWVGLPSFTHGVGRGGAEGGLVLPFATELPGDVDFGTMLGVSAVRDAAGGYGPEIVVSANAGHAIAGPVSGFIELVGRGDADEGVGASFMAGASVEIDRDLQIDAGVDVAVLNPVGAAAVFAGFTWRR